MDGDTGNDSPSEIENANCEVNVISDKPSPEEDDQPAGAPLDELPEAEPCAVNDPPCQSYKDHGMETTVQTALPNSHDKDSTLEDKNSKESAPKNTDIMETEPTAQEQQDSYEQVAASLPVSEISETKQSSEKNDSSLSFLDSKSDELNLQIEPEDSQSSQDSANLVESWVPNEPTESNESKDENQSVPDYPPMCTKQITYLKEEIKVEDISEPEDEKMKTSTYGTFKVADDQVKPEDPYFPHTADQNADNNGTVASESNSIGVKTGLFLHSESPQNSQMKQDSVSGGRSLHDTESSNASDMSASSSTTQPLEIDESSKVAPQADEVSLPPTNLQEITISKTNEKDDCTTKKDTTADSKQRDNAAADEEPEFDWEEYMEDTNTQAAPDMCFPHVEVSLRSNFEKGMKFEVRSRQQTDTFWLATVVMPCGQLLRLRFDGYGSDGSQDFWCDAFTGDLHPLGWCRQNGKTIEPPDDIKEKMASWEEYVQVTLDQAPTASDKLLGGGLGTAAVDQIKQGMLVEIQHELELTRVWIARVLENIGGRLLLRYEGIDWARQDFWLFYLHHRVHPLGWGQDNEMEYGPPEVVAEEWSRDEGWKAVLEKAQEEAESLPFPADVLADQEMVLEHTFQVGWHLEAIHPVKKSQVCPATITQIYSDTYFLVQIDDLDLAPVDNPVQICCHGGSRNILPINWCHRRGISITPPNGWSKSEFSWEEYLTTVEGEAAPDEAFTLDCGEINLKRGHRLEAVNPEHPGQICVATVTQVLSPLAFIHLESSPLLTSFYIVDCESQELFPVGWCDSNNYPLKPPHHAFFTRRQKSQNPADIPLIDGKPSDSSQHRPGLNDRGSSWCPKIYFNHRCFSGPYLSKGRIAELPKCVGPGPVTLVIKEVLSMLINVAYKSSRVLRELQLDGPSNPSLHQQVLKAKYKGKSYRAVVELCKSSDQVVNFCQEICLKLECCPHLFSLTFINGVCPENCSQQSKTKYTTYIGKKKKKVGRPPGGHTNLEGGAKKPGKRRKRKRFGLLKGKKSTDQNDDDDEEENPVFMEESSNSTTASIEMSNSGPPELRRKRKYTKQLGKPMEMVTRGVKLPRYSFDRKSRQQRAALQVMKPSKTKLSSPTGKHKGRKSAFVSPVKSEEKLVLDTNPLMWTVSEVMDYIKNTDCSALTGFFKREEIDGQALLLLTLPTVQELMEIKLGPAIKLCHLIEKLKIAFFEQYAV